MNTIKRTVWDMMELQGQLGIEVAKDVKSNLISTFEDKAYEQGKVHLLVNSGASMQSINIGDLSWENDDYSVVTSRGTIELNGERMDFKSKAEYEEYIEENEIEDAEDWWDFAEYDELCWNTFWQFDCQDIDLDVANQLELPVIELRNGDTYISISGCGMDLSFQMMQYQALALGRIEDRFANAGKLEWAKMNMSTDEYKEMLEKLGVDIDRLDEKYYTK